MSGLVRWFPVARNLNLPCAFTPLNAALGALGLALAAPRCPCPLYTSPSPRD